VCFSCAAQGSHLKKILKVVTKKLNVRQIINTKLKRNMDFKKFLPLIIAAVVIIEFTAG
jgi:hypothetical protein